MQRCHRQHIGRIARSATIARSNCHSPAQQCRYRLEWQVHLRIFDNRFPDPLNKFMSSRRSKTKGANGKIAAKMNKLIGLIMMAAAASTSHAGECTDDAMLVFDGSGSMAEMGFNDIAEPRIFEARRAVARAIPPIADIRRMGLVIYGPGGGECSGLDLRFPPLAHAGQRIVDEVDALQPAGDTALVEAVDLAAEVLGTDGQSGTIVLVTDGKETCGGAPCQLAARLADSGLTVHVIGFKIRGNFFDWGGEHDGGYAEAETVARCLADQTDGLYLGTETVDELIDALNRTLGCPMLSQAGWALN